MVPNEKLDEATEEIAKKILKNSRRAVGTIKLLVNQGMKSDFNSGMKLEMEASRGFLANVEPDEDRDGRLKSFHKKGMSAKSN